LITVTAGLIALGGGLLTVVVEVESEVLRDVESVTIGSAITEVLHTTATDITAHLVRLVSLFNIFFLDWFSQSSPCLLFNVKIIYKMLVD
jgi:hypothetical protein